jgi:hypothetical protein
MGVCKSVEYIEYDIELDEFEPLPMIKPYKYIKLAVLKSYYYLGFNETMLRSQKNNLYWIYRNENYFLGFNETMLRSQKNNI